MSESWKRDAEHRHFVTSDPNTLWKALEESCDRVLLLLARERESREALGEYGRHKDDCPGDFPLLDLHCNCGLEALLTQPVAGEGGKVRLEMAVVRRDEVIDIAKLHSVCWFSLINGQPHDVPRCGSCGGCMLFAALVEFDKQEALLAQPAAGEERGGGPS